MQLPDLIVGGIAEITGITPDAPENVAIRLRHLGFRAGREVRSVRAARWVALRWIADTTGLAEATPAMRELLDDDTLVELEVAPGEIRTTLAAGQSWAVAGGRVRTVLFQALSAAQQSSPSDLSGADAWYAQIAEVLRRDVAPFVDAHGGEIRIVSLSEDTLTVSLGGTCGHCSLRTTTLRNVVAQAVQAHFPQIRRVRAVRT